VARTDIGLLAALVLLAAGCGRLGYAPRGAGADGAAAGDGSSPEQDGGPTDAGTRSNAGE